MATLRQKIGQMLLLGFDGLTIDGTNPLNKWLTTDGLGGVILFDYNMQAQSWGKNLRDPKQIKELTKQLQTLSSNHPLFIALDYEGGEVDRLKKINGCPSTLSAAQLATLPLEKQDAAMRTMATTLKDLGFNLNFAPVVDLHVANNLGIIGKLGRSYSGNPNTTALYAERFVKLFNEQQIVCCYKHFPGHGSANGDTHLGFVDVTDTFTASELEPYTTIIQNQALNAMIMTAHVINKKLDPSGQPATLSKPILSDLLREQLNFSGVIISDDLQMRAIANHYTVEEALCLTINAGADMLIFANQLGNISAPTVIDIIERLVVTKDIPLQRIEEAYRRVVSLKTLIK